MEKKSKYAQPYSKGTVTEAKKSQDAGGAKVFPKSTRKREPAGANNFSKNDQSRKFGGNAQKTKNFDKRPKPKGHYYGGAKEDSKVEDLEAAEYGSVMVPGSKKQNLTHLLNFHHAPRDVQRGSQWSNRSSNTKYKLKGNGFLSAAMRHKYKELFLQVNCQFVVAKNGHYSLYLNNPDALVEWNLVEQVRFHTYGKLSCPICLNSPVAAKITRCGHVYCWHCILHYLQVSEKDIVKCPICFDSVNKSDLKSVLGISQETVNIGDNISLRLMRRQKGSLIATEVREDGDSNTPTPTTFFTVLESEGRQGYSRLLLADIGDILDIIANEREELEIALAEDSENPENCFIQQACEELKKRENHLLEQLSESFSQNAAIGVNSNSEIQNKKQSQNEDSATENTDKNENNLNSSESELSSMITLDSSLNLPKAEEKYYYFYQAVDGQNIYLHAMNVKMLEQQYESLDKCPRLISGKLLEIETRNLTSDLRYRLNFLNHLPINCPFELVEIEMRSPLVSKEVLDCYKYQINARQKQRKDREYEERRRERKITEEENKRMGKYPTPQIHIESQFHFPDFQPEILYAETNGTMEVDIGHSPSFNESSTSETSELSFSPPVNVNANQSLTRSFAQTVSSLGPRNIVKSTWPAVGSSSSQSAVTASKSSTVVDDDDSPKPMNLTVFDFIVPESSGRKSGGKNKKKNKAKFRALHDN